MMYQGHEIPDDSDLAQALRTKNVPRPVQRPPQFSSPPPAATPVDIDDDIVTENVQSDVQSDAEMPDERSLLNRSVRRGAQDILSTPGTILGTLPAAVSAVVDWKLRGTVDSWGEGMLNEDARELYRIKEDESHSVHERQVAEYLLAQQGNDALRDGARIGLDMYEWAGEVVDAQDAADGSIPMDEQIGGVGLTSALTLPLAPLRAVGIAGQVAQRTALGTVRNAALRGAEFMTPVTIVQRGSTAKQIAAAQVINGTVGIGIDQAARGLMGEETLFTEPEYAPDDDGLPGFGGDELLTTGAIVGTGALGIAAITQPGRLRRMVTDVGNPSQRIIDAQNAADAAARSIPVERSEPTMRVGKAVPTTAREVAQDVGGYIFDDKAIIRNAAERVGVIGTQEVDDTVRTLTGASLTDQVRRAYEFGDYGANVRGPAINNWKQEFGTLSARDKATFDMAYEAADELARRQRGIRSLPNLSEADLHARFQRGQSNPATNKLIRDYREIMRSFSQLRYKRGIIDEDQLTREMSDRNFYMRNVEQETFDSVWERVASLPKRGAAMFRKHIGTAPEEMQATQGGMEAKIRPSEILDQYSTRQLRNINYNEARRQILQTLSGKTLTNKPRTIVVNKQRKGSADTARTITVFDGGRKLSYEIGDARLHTALQFRPRYTIPLASDLRRWMQMGTTGNLNPLFLPISLLNDLGAGLLGMRTHNMVSGHFDAAMKRVLEGAGMSPELANRVRNVMAGPTRLADTPLTLVEGLWEGAKGRWLEAATTSVQSIAQKSGNPVDIAKANRALERFYNTRYARMQESGYAPNAFVVDYDNANNAMTNMVNGARRNRVWRSYTNMLETVREAYRMGIFSRNVAFDEARLGRTLPKDRISRIAGEVRELGSDITKQSTSQVLNAALSTVPFGNTILQSTAHLLNHLFTNPAAWSVATTIVGMRTVSNMTMSQEARDYVNTQIPDYARSDTMYIEVEREDGEPFDPHKHLEAIHLSPELGMVTGLATDLFDAMLTEAGLVERDDAPGATTIAQRTAYMLGELIGFTTPPLVNMGAHAMDMGPVDMASAMRGDGLFRAPRMDSGQADQRGYGLDGGWIGDRIANMLNTAFGTAGRTVSAGLEAAIDHPSGTLTADAWADAMDVMKYEYVDRQKVGQWLTDAEKALPRSTPRANTAHNLDRGLEEAATLARIAVPNISEYADADLYAGQSFQLMVEQLDDVKLAQQAEYLHRYLLSPMHQHDMEAVGQAKIRQHRIRGSFEGTAQERVKMLNDINADVQERFDRVLSNYSDLEHAMADISDDPEWTLDKFLRSARADLMQD